MWTSGHEINPLVHMHQRVTVVESVCQSLRQSVNNSALNHFHLENSIMYSVCNEGRKSLWGFLSQLPLLHSYSTSCILWLLLVSHFLAAEYLHVCTSKYSCGRSVSCFCQCEKL